MAFAFAYLLKPPVATFFELLPNRIGILTFPRMLLSIALTKNVRNLLETVDKNGGHPKTAKQTLACNLRDLYRRVRTPKNRSSISEMFFAEKEVNPENFRNGPLLEWHEHALERASVYVLYMKKGYRISELFLYWLRNSIHLVSWGILAAFRPIVLFNSPSRLEAVTWALPVGLGSSSTVFFVPMLVELNLRIRSELKMIRQLHR